jgi:tripartite-type tricarboxylate transporter receptor subunit TctC
MRVLGQKMSESLGQPIVVENRGGAGGRNGAEAIARAAPDGYTLGVANTSTHGIVPITTPKLGYDPVKSFSLIGPIGFYPLVMVCNASLPTNNIQELIAYTKANPGKVSYGSPGAGGQGHFAGEFLKARTGIEMLHVPYRGTGPLLQDVIAGVVNCVFDGTSKPHIERGAVRAYVLTSANPDPMYPGVPSMAEAGFKDFDMVTWVGLVGPAGLPRDLIENLNQALNRALQDTKVIEAIRAIGTTPRGGSPQDLQRTIEHDVQMYGSIAREANIKPD